MDNIVKIREIRARLLCGELTYDEAKELCAPLIDEMNATGKEIAKKHGKRFYGFTFTGLMR